MPRARSPKRDEAYKIWLDSGGKKKLKDIASDLGVSETQIRKWKNLDKWNGNVTNQSKGNVTKRKRGGQPGNHNATGPPGNKNAEKYGFFSKYLPEETVSIIQEMPTDPLDILWHEIQIAYAAIIRAQQIMYVKDKSDKTIEKVEKKDGNVIGERWEVQQAWDKHANFLKAQARAMSDLRGSIRQYDELLHKRWDLATDEQKARIEALRAKVKDNGQVSAEDKVKKLFEAIGGALDEIQIAYAAIIRAQQIMYVKDKSDKTIEKVEKKDGNVIGERWEVQQAWDKHANFLKAQARAMSDLRGSIRQYDELLHKRWDLATDEQKARIEALRAKVKDNGQVSAEDKVKKLFEAIGGALDDEAGAE